jgi:hypothetical protein
MFRTSFPGPNTHTPFMFPGHTHAQKGLIATFSCAPPQVLEEATAFNAYPLSSPHSLLTGIGCYMVSSFSETKFKRFPCGVKQKGGYTKPESMGFMASCNMNTQSSHMHRHIRVHTLSPVILVNSWAHTFTCAHMHTLTLDHICTYTHTYMHTVVHSSPEASQVQQAQLRPTSG